ncbi:flavin reductase [Streptomyces murinus]|uniref:flavin reductase n=1 Tax=Streptomyces murinus TaxID=33900 RepID=UPI0037A950B8
MAWGFLLSRPIWSGRALRGPASRQDRTLPALMSAGAFVVSFLAGSGEAASQAFTGKGQDEFSAVNGIPSEVAQGAPVLSEYSTWPRLALHQTG